ncbi:PREDICTED: thyroid transcription factor 1-associated protein 26 homolog [Wasmannia auropunctata]|uniref:thyroid transcription factor 1-associated protein 26 homolog n=1 Tax=Wasmannia auropunctata TaxID=64793 RepID=UPI0005EEC9C2|nr:PREDICTED: thyroid transcription factor 1-associated protein 26 homolog [Wasmannia auropunctata]
MRNSARNVKDNKNRTGKNGNNDKPREKKFDKKKYRLQKYSNKYKIEQWEEKRKKAVLLGFYNQLKRDEQNSAGTSLNLGDASNSADETSKPRKKGYAFFKARQEYKRKREEKKKRKEEAVRVRAEREEALRKYKEQKMRNFKILSKKTKKGQPVMRGRIELLLEKIQQSVT